MFADFPPPPRDPLARVEWANDLLATALWETSQGRGNTQLNEEFRAMCNSMARLVPYERVLQAEKTINDASKPAKARTATNHIMRPAADTGREPLRG